MHEHANRLWAQSTTTEPFRLVPITEFTPQGTIRATSTTSTSSYPVRAGIAVPSRKVIPVIFVPGIMGSNLKALAAAFNDKKERQAGANESTTAVLANAAGPLELLPNHLYPKGWLVAAPQPFYVLGGISLGQGVSDLVDAPLQHALQDLKQQITLQIGQPAGAGDGTVPQPSGSAPTGIKQLFALTGFDHQGSYNNAEVRDMLLYSIGKIVQGAQ